jgi:hypothetical protein
MKMSINIEDLTIKQAKELSGLFGSEKSKANPFKIDGKYFIRTVTHAHTGRVKSITGQFITLSDAAWIADTGRFYDALKNTEFSEIEPFSSDLILNMDSIIDATTICGDLPAVQK